MSQPLARNRDFRLLWINGLFTALGAQVSSLALPLLVLRQTGSTVQAAAIGTVSLVALLITLLPGGALADTVERRRLMRVCNVGSLLVVAALTVEVIRGAAPVSLVLLAAAAGAVLTSFYGPAAVGLMRAVVPPEQFSQASSRLQARTAAVRIVGPLIGGALFAWHSAAPFATETVALVISMVCLALLRTRSAPASRPAGRRAFAEMGAGWRFLWRRPFLRTVLLVFGVGVNGAFGGVIFAALAVASDEGHVGIAGGGVVSMTAAGSLLGALVAPRLRPEAHPRAFIIATCWSCAVAVAVVSVFPGRLVIGALMGLCTMVAGIGNIGFLTAMYAATPPDMVGRVQSSAVFMSSLVQPLGPVAAGALLAVGGAGVTFGVLAAVFTVCALVVTLARSMRSPAPIAPDPLADPIAGPAPAAS